MPWKISFILMHCCYWMLLVITLLCLKLQRSSMSNSWYYIISFHNVMIRIIIFIWEKQLSCHEMTFELTLDLILLKNWVSHSLSNILGVTHNAFQRPKLLEVIANDAFELISEWSLWMPILLIFPVFMSYWSNCLMFGVK